MSTDSWILHSVVQIWNRNILLVMGLDMLKPAFLEVKEPPKDLSLALSVPRNSRINNTEKLLE